MGNAGSHDHSGTTLQPPRGTDSPDPQSDRASGRLRLSTILSAFAADAAPRVTVHASPAVPDGAGPPANDPRAPSDISLGEIIDRTAHAGFGFIAALLALIAIPFVGSSLLFGLAIAFIGAQMMAGLNRPWLPRRVRQHLVALSTLDWLGRRLAAWTAGLERWVRPRWTVLARGPFWFAVGAGIVLQGLGLALPLPIPGSNWPFIFVILIYGIGLLEDDGLLVLAGHACTAAGLVLAIVFRYAIAAAMGHSISWVRGLFGH
jgi:hypothetical protein